MTTQDSKPRRKPVTYGKKSSHRPLHMYNFLDIDLDSGVSKSSKVLETSPTRSDWQPLQKRSHDADTTETTTEDACPVENSSTSPNSSIQDKPDNVQRGSMTSSVFDLVSSDEEMDRTRDAQPTSKRRKLTPVRQITKQVQGQGRLAVPASKAHDSRDQDTAPASSSKSTPASSVTEHSLGKSKSRPPSPVASKSRKRIPAPRKGASVDMPFDLIDSEEEEHIVSMTNTPTPPHTPVRRSPKIVRNNSNSPSAQLIEQLQRSIPFESRLTKQKDRMAGQVYNEIGVPSPSQLAMRSLRLTPEEVPPAGLEREGHDSPPGTRPLTPSRSRPRLIDALDSPLRKSIVQQTSVESPGSSEESSINDENDFGDSASQGDIQTSRYQVETKEEPPSKPIPALPVTGPKVTYAKQRSHLSDMVLEDLSDLSVPSIAHLVEPAATSKASVTTAFSTQRSVEEPDDEEDATGGAIRSIHELRQAGEYSRFQGNLDSIFEDLEAAGRTGRSRRLRGLMVLTQKFLEPGFCQRFVENGMDQRLADHALNETDVLSSILANCALSILICSTKPSLKVLQNVFDAVMHSSAPLLEERRELSKFVKALAKDRQQNLSGAMCKDVIDFQQIVLNSRMWNNHKPKDISPQLIALRSIEIAIRGIREMKDFETSLTPQLFSQLVAILEAIAQNPNNECTTSESVLTLESTISALEFSSLSQGLLEDGYNDAATRLHVLGQLLTKAEVLPKERRDKVEQLILRLIISVTNNNAVLCESLGRTTLIAAIAVIVRKSFLELAEHADSGQVLDEGKLESVILALGSLINFAECSASSRQTMNMNDDLGGSTVDWLVAAFTKRAGKASEASSLEQTHALVTFGYLSMLICTLCLDDKIRNTVRSRMKSKSLHPLTLAVEEFLNHFRIVEQVMDEDDANNFTNRFGGILDALKEAEGMA